LNRPFKADAEIPEIDLAKIYPEAASNPQKYLSFNVKADPLYYGNKK